MTGLRILFALVFPLCSGGGGWAQIARKPEYFLKAEYMAFVGQASTMWGNGGGSEARRTFRLGVVGRSPFEGYLNQIYRQRTIHGRSVKIVFPRTLEEMETCQMVFVCRSEADRLEEILERLRGRPIITVGDSRGFLSRGVMVNFTLEQDRVVIWVNLDVAKQGGVSFAPDFLALVRIYSGDEGG